MQPLAHAEEERVRSDDGGAISSVIEIGKAEILIRHYKLLEMRISVDWPRRQPPAEVAERLTRPVLEWLSHCAKVPKSTRADLVEQAFGMRRSLATSLWSAKDRRCHLQADWLAAVAAEGTTHRRCDTQRHTPARISGCRRVLAVRSLNGRARFYSTRSVTRRRVSAHGSRAPETCD
jgi:hypothetical protein